ncbi:23S rRNA (adenine(2503)-C(2))-methyltransferase RlmN [Puniceicoccales bacterium CK1056]|uniref:Probable dual-specificity RNA methyltransferase RlmN n=1 Tax=Oceanipulchritudo coccoides TaxID=2706888 RepID=A0A6B2M577_9BACT|nr:23S rRNA (adenine(2503)-C(2))-methyltransferase RlmN [Oceanipulchritudo coccoides]NDV63274.1 23S rRNA (adenine(2503)-C(2))-methyltransferase RlmN [Oceanipulchritudo coccoides]
MRFQPSKPSLYGMSPDQLVAFLKPAGFPAFRAKQILDWLYRKRVASFKEMTNLPTALIEWLDLNACMSPNSVLLVKKASDVTEKLLLEGEDKSLVETVLIRYPQRGVGSESSRKTICVSSQVGCAYGCKFCASGLAGWKRDLTDAEIIAQFIHVARIEQERDASRPDQSVPFDNIVFMGMGEPLANYDNVVNAIRTLNAEWGLHFGARRITVSTSGLVPQIHKLADEPIQFRLALSLHGATNEVRQKIMPINKRYPLEELIPAVQAFSDKHGRMLTLEFILIDSVNDSFEQAHKLAQIAQSLHAHVNIIPYNRVEGLPWKRPNINRQMAFSKILKEARISHTVRKEKGHDIDAACGQLRLQTEKQRQA